MQEELHIRGFILNLDETQEVSVNILKFIKKLVSATMVACGTHIKLIVGALANILII